MVREFLDKLRKGVKAGMAAIKQSNTLTDSRVVRLIFDFNASKTREWMLTGEKYYQVDNDILERTDTRIVNGKVVSESYKANNRLAHAKYKGQVDEKVAYLLAKPVTYQCGDDGPGKQYKELVKGILGKHFQHQFSELGYEASNKGIAWLHVYVDEQGVLRTMVIPAEQCIPVWKDASHTELETLIRVYTVDVWEYDTRKTVTNVEVWQADSVAYYRLEGKLLVWDDTMNDDGEYGPVSHIKTTLDGWRSWGRIPFVPFKNNQKELPDIKFVKSLLDAYDSGRSEAANYVEDVKNLIYVLKGYGGADLDEFMEDLNRNRAIKIDDPEDGGVDTLTPQMDITALREHYEQLKRDIAEDGQAVDKDPDRYGNSPSGVALKFMYAGLDLKCNLMETEFKLGFEQLLFFIDEYLKLTGKGDFTAVDLDIVFNRNMAINEAEQIQNCSNSRGMVSDKTILSRHPYVEDVEAELAALEDQQSNDPAWDNVPVKKAGEGDGKE